MNNLLDFVNENEEIYEFEINKEIERKKKEFEFMRELIKENYNEIKEYSDKTGPKSSITNMYEILKKICRFIKNYRDHALYLDSKSEITIEKAEDSFYAKMGLFELEDKSEPRGYLKITEKGKRMKEKYFS